MKAGFIFINDENSSYDHNFIDSAQKACYTAAVELAEADCNMIFASVYEGRYNPH